MTDMEDVQESRGLILDRGRGRSVEGSARLEQSIKRRRKILRFPRSGLLRRFRRNRQREPCRALQWRGPDTGSTMLLRFPDYDGEYSFGDVLAAHRYVHQGAEAADLPLRCH